MVVMVHIQQLKLALQRPCPRFQSAKNHPPQPRVEHRSNAHNTRLYGHVQIAPWQAIVGLGKRAATQRYHLCMGAWITTADRLIVSLGNDLAVLY